MTWGECRLECLRKMFASEGGTVNETDESVQDYLYAMPQAANEGVSLICAARAIVLPGCALSLFHHRCVPIRA